MPSEPEKSTDLSPPYGRWYAKGCRFVQDKFGPSSAKIEQNAKKAKERFMEEEKKYNQSLAEFREIEYTHQSNDPIYKKAARKHKKDEKRFKRAERIYTQEKFKKAVYFTGLNVELHEVILFASFLGFISLVIALLSAIIFIILLRIPILVAALYILPTVTITPLVVFSFIASYPEILANRLRAKSIGRTPEAINYLIMSMRQNPSLNRAVAFAAENSEEPISSSMKKVQWDIYMRKHQSIEEAFREFAYEWGYWNDDFKRSLYAIKSSTLERTGEGLNRALDKANDIILEGTRRQIDKFAASLSGPTTILFALGILLPMVIGAMLPMMSISVPANPQELTGGQVQGVNQTVTQTAPDSMPIIILVMDVLFPFITFIYAYHILGKRPGTSSPPRVKSRLSQKQHRMIIASSIVICIILGVLGLPLLRERFGLIGTLIGSLPILWAFGLSLGYYCLSTSASQKKRRDEIKKMEDEFPDALFQLGSRIAEGEPLERALKKTSEAMKGTSIAELFAKIAYGLQVTRGTLNDVLFGKNGVLNEVPSRTIHATMKSVVEIVKKDAFTAGQTIVNISNYLRDMKKVEHDIKTQLSQTVDMMKTTGILFAPLVMGITAALYVLLSEEFSKMPNAAPMIPNDIFFLILGFYLAFVVIITMFFTTGIEHGEDNIQLKYSIGTALPVAIIIYTLAVILGQLMIG
jgi:Flp pilus assembly protein TadB